MFERMKEPVVSRSIFLRRLAASTIVGMMALVGSLAAGMIGYHALEGLGWIDSFLNAAMLMGGMGPLDHQRGDAGKIFEGMYALYCGLAVITIAGVMAAPVVHRFMHKHFNEN